MFQGAQEHPSFRDMLGDSQDSARSWLMVITYPNKGYKAESAKEKGAWANILRKPGTSFQDSSPSGVTGDVFNSFQQVVATPHV